MLVKLDGIYISIEIKKVEVFSKVLNRQFIEKVI